MNTFSRALMQSSRNVLMVLSLYASLVLLPATGLAQPQVCTTPTGDTVGAIVFSLQLQEQCYGGSRDNSELKLWFDQQLTAAEIPDHGELRESHLMAVEAIMQRLSSTMRSHAIAFENAGWPGEQALQAMAERLASEAPSQTTGQSPGTVIDDDDGGWIVQFEEDGDSANDINQAALYPRTTLLQPNCQPQTASVACRAAVDAVVDLVRVASLMQSVNQRASRSLGVNMQAYQRAGAMWDLYSNDTRVQYPWEMLLNGYLYQQDINQLGAEQGRDVALVNRLPPDHQIILLHPGVGLEYVDDATDGSRLEPAVVMEWLGFNTWR